VLGGGESDAYVDCANPDTLIFWAGSNGYNTPPSRRPAGPLGGGDSSWNAEAVPGRSRAINAGSGARRRCAAASAPCALART